MEKLLSNIESKEQAAYSNVFETTQKLFHQFKINFILPQVIMSDFDFAIVNAAEGNLGKIVYCCLFHLCQSVFRRVQTKYDENDCSIKQDMQMMCDLAFVPPDRVPEFFDIFMDDVPEDFIHVADYFELHNIKKIILFYLFKIYL